MSDFKSVKLRDVVLRNIGHGVIMKLKVTMVDYREGGLIHCGPWKFRRDNGAEVDEELGWGDVNAQNEMWTGSRLVHDAA